MEPGLSTPLEGGPRNGSAIDPNSFGELLSTYYRARDERGSRLPLLERLEMEAVVDNETPVGDRYE